MAKRKKWNIGDRGADPAAIDAIAGQLGISPVTAALLCKRGYRSAAEANRFLRMESELLHDPFLMRDMDRACRRIASALSDGEKIVIYGDYDVDGVTSVSILCLYLRAHGGNVDYYIPSRSAEGYGVNAEALKKLREEGAGLIITVDTGITAVAEAEYASQLGCDMVITDHHECREILPKACAVVNPRRDDCPYPFKELAGVGVAFKLITALEMTLRGQEGKSAQGFLTALCRDYIDLVAIGTVADVMPLRDENRLIVSMGLAYINRSARPGVRALLDASDGSRSGQRKKATSTLIGFTLAPRINAAGRIISASRAAELFLTSSETEAQKIAAELCEINRRRQYEENKIVDQISKRTEELGPESDPVIVLADEQWHHGVIGIVASRVTEKYGRPSILISFDGELGKGSGRSVRGLNLVEALSACEDCLVKFGGHELAAGLTIRREMLPDFRRRINEYAREHLTKEAMTADLDIDFELLPQEATLRQAEELELLEPFGISNPVPLFVMRDLTVDTVTPIGAGRHSKLGLRKGKDSFAAVCFGASPAELGYAGGDPVDIAFNLNVNEFRGSSAAQLVIRDIRFTADAALRRKEQLETYEAVMRGEIPCSELPEREEFVGVYLQLKRSFPEGRGVICINTLLSDLILSPSSSGLSYVKLRLALDILHDSGVISLECSESGEAGMERFGITIHNLEKKVCLEQSCLYKRLTKQAKMNTQG